MVSKTRFNTRR